MQYNRSFGYPLYVLSAKSSFKIIKLFPALITFCFFPPLNIPSPAKHPQHARASFACHELVALKFAVETYSEQALLFGRVNRVARERASERRSFACPIGELARRLVETRLPIIAYTGRNKLTFKFKL